MKRKLLFFIISFLFFQQIWAQHPISGVVLSADNKEPVIGASVVVKGTTIGVVTDIDGQFTVSLPENNQTLVFSYIGMHTQEVKAKPDMKVFMESATQDIDEVIVVAYGTAKKSSFTGSAANIGKDKIEKLQISEVSKALEGAIAGVQISSSSGQPGSSASIRVRGIGSISASSSPLIVLDGVPYEGALNSIPPQDIESMSVLKDAAANSLYGARGANGVIMITTKKGKAGKVSMTFENRTGVNYRGLGSYSTLRSSREYYELYWEALRNQQVFTGGKDYVTAGKYASDNLVSTLGGYNNYNVPANQLIDPVSGLLNPEARLLYQDNWYDEAFSHGLRQENNFTLSGGTDRSNYYFSLGYLYDDSYTDKSNLSRYSTRLKLDQKITDWLDMSVNLGAIGTVSNIPQVGGTATNSIFYTGLMAAPIFPVYRRDENGNYMTGGNGKRLYDYGITEGHSRPFAANANPIAEQSENIRKTNRDVITGKLQVNVDLWKGLRFTTNLALDNFNGNSTNFQTPIGGAAMALNGMSTRAWSRTTSLNFNQLLNYIQSWNRHELAVLLGHESKKDWNSYLSATKTNFYLPTNPELDNGVNIKGASSYSDTYSLEGYFSQVKYNLADKYYLSASYRLDGSSRFHPKERWGHFWSAGASWRVSQESFLHPYSFVNDLKLKASFGTQGNDNLGNSVPYMTQAVVVPGNDENSFPATQVVFLGNPKITWEKSNNFNIGADFRLWNRFSGVIEYFYKQTWDLLYARPRAPSQGSPSVIWENTMKMYNSGVEAEIAYDIYNRPDFQWNVSVNMTHYKNRLKELPEDFNEQGYWEDGAQLRRKGASIYNWYGYKFAGVDPANGSALYYKDVYDENGNVTGRTTTTKSNEATKYEYGKTSIPDLYGGFNTSLRYRGLDFGATFAYQIGGWAEDTQYRNMMTGGFAGTNWHTDIYRRWTPSNPNTDVPRVEEMYQDANAQSDRFLTKASYLSLRNVTVGYTLRLPAIKKAGIENLRFYVTGDNLFLISKRKGFDPRQSFSGNTGFSYDGVSTCSFGFNINF